MLVVVPAADAAEPVSIVGSADPQTVTLVRQSDKTLLGNLVLLVRNSSAKSARLRLSFFPADGSSHIRLPGKPDAVISLLGADGQPADKAPQIPAHRLGHVVLQFKLPTDASPSDADGQLSLGLKAQKAKGKPTVAQVKGAGASFPGITFQPAKVTLQSTSPAPWKDAPSPSQRVQLEGPGVPALFAEGARAPARSMLVVDGAGHELQVSLKSLRRESPLVASAEVKATGDLEPGGYDVKLGLTPLSTDAPKLDVRVEVKDLLVWPVGTVLLGALAALLVFLGTGLNRRKALLRIQLRAVLERYRKERESLGATAPDQPALIWAIEDLGDPNHWYERKWDALPELDGARGIWSSISYARSDGDLEDDDHHVLAVQARVTRWLKALPPAKSLAEWDQLGQRHLPYAGKSWASTHVSNDTQILLGLAEDEPPDDPAAEKMIGRLRRQGRWHRAFAEVWDLWVQLGKHMDSHPESYSEAQRAQFNGLELDKLDEKADELKRTPESQRKCEHDLEGSQGTIVELMKHGNVPPPKDAPLHFELLAESPDDAYRELRRPAPAPVVARAEDKPSRREAYQGVIWSDLAWTLAIAFLTAVAYMVPLYNSTWGSLTDYGTAFAAGFLGKIGIQWAAMPLFQSIRIRAKRDREAATDSAPAKTAAATGGAAT